MTVRKRTEETVSPEENKYSSGDSDSEGEFPAEHNTEEPENPSEETVVMEHV